MTYIDLRADMAKAAGDTGPGAKLNRWGLNQNFIGLFRDFGEKASILFKSGDGSIQKSPVDALTLIDDEGRLSVQSPDKQGRLNLPFLCIQGIEIDSDVDVYVRDEGGTHVKVGPPSNHL